jgi:hypothetical protein
MIKKKLVSLNATMDAYDVNEVEKTKSISYHEENRMHDMEEMAQLMAYEM